MKAIKIFILLTFVFAGSSMYAQRGHGNGHGRGRGGGERVVVRSSYRPANVVVYHPAWRPAYDYHRRWVYFPRYNFYWDNWRNHYVYLNGNVWVSQPTPPPAVININLGNERHNELRERDDDNDDIYKTNDAHRTQYKAD